MPTRFLTLASGLALSTLLFGGPAFGQATTYGPATDLGDGTVRTYVTADDAGQPMEVGVAFSKGALENLPAPVGDDMEANSHGWVLPMPAGAPTPYTFVGFGYNALGHDPAGVYDVPHFDFHFNFIPQDERDAILPSDPDWDAKANRAPEADMIPAGYQLFPNTAVPQMGTHWLDPSSPELNGTPFTETLIYGTWDGRLIFVEPMITADFLRSGQDAVTDMPAPEKVAIPGWYATRYSVHTDPASGEVRVALTGLTKKE